MGFENFSEPIKPFTLGDAISVLLSRRLTLGLFVAGIFAAIVYVNTAQRPSYEASATLTIGYYYPISKQGQVGSLKPIEPAETLIRRLMRENAPQASGKNPAAAITIEAVLMEPSQAHTPPSIRLTVRDADADQVNMRLNSLVTNVTQAHTTLSNDIANERAVELAWVTQKVAALQPHVTSLWRQVANLDTHKQTDFRFLFKTIDIENFLDDLRARQAALKANSLPHATAHTTLFAVASYNRAYWWRTLALGLAFALVIGSILTVALDSLLKTPLLARSKG